MIYHLFGYRQELAQGADEEEDSPFQDIEEHTDATMVRHYRSAEDR